MNSLIWQKQAHITSKFKDNLKLQADNIMIYLSFHSRVIQVKFGEQFSIELLDDVGWCFCNFVASELLLGKMKRNLDRICDENYIVVVEQRDYQIVQHAFENN